MNSLVLSVQQVSKSFPLKNGQRVAALDSITFSVLAGEVTALVGPDGAGKSTLLRLVAGLLVPESGAIQFFENPSAEPISDAQGNMGYMPQRFGLYEDLTVQENLDLYADLKSVPAQEREQRYADLLAMSGMEPFRKRLAGKLSGGMKQKLGLICTLISPPRLLLLDEPTVGVDPLSRRELWRMIEQLTSHSGMAVIVSTAYMDEAAKCDSVVLLFEGKALAVGSPESIRRKADGMSWLAKPVLGDTPRVLQARLLGAQRGMDSVPQSIIDAVPQSIIDAVPQGGSVRFVHGTLTPAQQSRVTALLRGATVTATSADLEDSFMLLLRAQTKPVSPGNWFGDFNNDPAAKNDAAFADLSVFTDAPIIVTEHVSRFFGDFIAVDDVSFSVRKGEVFGLLGPNGAGKTTTFRMLCGLLPASKGTLHVAGVDVRHAREEARRHLGYVAQKFSLYGPLSVVENLDFFAGAYGLRGQAKTQRVHQVVADFSLQQFVHVPAELLPGGYRQRLAMAVGLLHQPAILFLDEPTSGADPLARREFWARITYLADSGVTIVVTTHFMEEAEYCDKILIQDRGRMLALGTPEEIRAQAGQAQTMEDAFIHIVDNARTATGESS